MTSDSDDESQTGEEGISVSSRLFLLLILGFAFVLIGIALVSVATVLYGSGSGSFGGVIFIGPVPIVFGAGPDATLMVLFSIIIAVLCVMTFLVMHRRTRSSGS